MTDLASTWRVLWADLRAAWLRRDLEQAMTLGGEIVRLAGVLRARIRNRQRRRRGAGRPVTGP
jgi:hypothetical protein